MSGGTQTSSYQGFFQAPVDFRLLKKNPRSEELAKVSISHTGLSHRPGLSQLRFTPAVANTYWPVCRGRERAAQNRKRREDPLCHRGD